MEVCSKTALEITTDRSPDREKLVLGIVLSLFFSTDVYEVVKYIVDEYNLSKEYMHKTCIQRKYLYFKMP